ncbi:hypothetical protein [Comamonas aquatica]|uniref:hypothetical protein n=1 Tax=Comamonas aquatica TaxID=225991 RepID=UPI001E80D7CA|nr:hypothetical protein [Comamonas aquatica]CAC9684749.1 Uncharacterised protein [Comamonas aquatica]
MNNGFNPIDIYLDLNIYISIAKKEPFHEYLIAKINNLKKLNITFPHSPAHAEEVSALIVSKRDPATARKLTRLIQKYNNNIGYKPGSLNDAEALEAFQLYRQQVNIDPRFIGISEYYLNVAAKNRSGEIKEEDHATQRISENFESRLKIAGDQTYLNDFANHMEKYFLGRRNKQSLKENFSTINESTDNIKTFEDIHKKNMELAHD